jgi:nitroreductase/NAD-dependent dihydropyrimidine dehydrogenase PreA subunit
MSRIHIDPARCVHCNTCAEGCVLGIIDRATDTTFPHLLPELEELCLRCGHCEAFCPQDALVLEFLREQRHETPVPCGFIDPDSLILHLKLRRSVRQFKPEPVPRAILERILDAARYAPSGGNQQPVGWLVLTDAAEVRRVAGLTVEWMRTLPGTDHPLAPYAGFIIEKWDAGADPICYGAPHLVFAHLPRTGEVDDPTEGVIAMTHVDLAAPSFGLGACWAGFVKMACDGHAPLRDALALPGDRTVACALLLGVPRHPPLRIPGRNPTDVTWG